MARNVYNMHISCRRYQENAVTVKQKKRILVWGLSNNRAGTEAVICNYVKSLPEVGFDFLCYDVPANHADLFQNGKNRYFVIPIKIKHPLKSQIALRKFMKENASNYSALWFNVNDISNIDLLKLAKQYDIPQRITHIHNPRFPDVFITKLFSRINWKKCLEITTDYWACSEEAGNFLFRDRAFRVIPNMVDAENRSFSLEKRKAIRKQWGIDDCFVIGTVGRLAEQKNHEFLVRLLPKLQKVEENIKIVVVGDGPLKDDLLALAESLNVTNRIILTGSQSDIQGYLSSFDVYAFPSLYEGLSLSILEAQYNELPCIVSEGIGDSSIISKNLTRIPLKNEEEWIKALLSAKRIPCSLIEDKAKLFRLDNIRNIALTLFR